MQSEQNKLFEEVIVVKPSSGRADQSVASQTRATASYRAGDSVNFPVDNEATIAKEFVQLKLRKKSQLPITLDDIKEETQLQKIVVFFKQNPFINLNNFMQAEHLLTSYLNDPLAFVEKLEKLREEFDKSTKNNEKFGKVVMSFTLRSKGLRIKLDRPKLKGCSQSIAINFNTKLNPSMIAMTSYNWKHKKVELIRSKSNFKPIARRNAASIDFDAKVWQAFNAAGIEQKNYMKSLDCLERNYLDLPKFVHEVNKKDLSNMLNASLINNVAIKTDNENTTFVNFTTNSAQKVEAKMTKFASSLIICS